MKYRVKIHDRSFEVEIEDINQQPISARIDGKTYEVWVTEEDNLMVKTKKSVDLPSETPKDKLLESKSRISSAPIASNHKKTINSPIPGTIISIDVKPGQEVTTGQPICVIEAMKMKNTIRSPRDGIIQFVPIQVGQHVRHNELLAEFSD